MTMTMTMTMTNNFNLVLVASLLLAATTSWWMPAEAYFTLYPNYSTEDAKRDFESLNKWLIKQLPDVDEPGVNLVHATNKLHNTPACKWCQWFKGNLVKPIEIIEDLSKIEECDERAVELIRVVHRASKNGKNGRRRVDKLMTHYGHLASIKCEAYLENRYVDIYENNLNLDIVAQLFKVLKPKFAGKYEFQFHLSTMDVINEFNYDDIFEAMKVLAKDDPQNVFVNVRPDERTGIIQRVLFKGNAKYVYDTYLVQPCNYYNQVMKQFTQSFYAIKDYLDLDDYYNTKFVSKHSEAVQMGIFRYLVCEKVLKTDVGLAKIYQKMRNYR